MGTRLLVTIGTDGATNWVRTADGQKFNLGSVSILSFVAKLVLGGSREARRALDGFLRGEEVLLRVDEDRMWELLAPRRSRWGSADSFIPQDQCISRGMTMTLNIEKNLMALERHVQMLDKAAKSNVPSKKMAEGVSILMKMASKIEAEDEDEDEDEDEEVQEEVEATSESTDKLAFDLYKANSKLATGILDKMEAVNERIDEIKKSGKKGFNSTRAKADVHDLTSKVASILSEVDIATTSWVTDDFRKLANRANYLHGLFFPKA